MLGNISDIKLWLCANTVPLYTRGLSQNELWHEDSPNTGTKGQCTYRRIDRFSMCSLSMNQ